MSTPLTPNLSTDRLSRDENLPLVTEEPSSSDTVGHQDTLVARPEGSPSTLR